MPTRRRKGLESKILEKPPADSSAIAWQLNDVTNNMAEEIDSVESRVDSKPCYLEDWSPLDLLPTAKAAENGIGKPDP